MESNVISYRTNNSELINYDKPIAARFHNSVDLNEDSASGYITFSIKKNDVDHFINQIKYRQQFGLMKEQYCFIAIRNLIKKNEFLQLSLQLAENQITEQEFEDELDNNSEKYLIKLDYLKNNTDLEVIADIINNIGKQFNVDEVSEMFSIETNSLNNGLKTLDFQK